MSPRPLRAGALATLAASMLVAGPLAGTAPASAGMVVPSGTGLTLAQGMTRSGDGAIWVADHLKGICRMALSPRLNLVEDDYCAIAHVGPKAPLGLTFDSATNNFYVGDAASNNGSIWRLHWDPETKAIDSATRMLSLPGDRAAALTLVPAASGASAPDLVYATKRSSALMRVADPGGVAQEPVTVGFAGQQSPLAMAFLDGKLYLAEGASVTRLDLGAGSPGVAAPVPGLPGLVNALVADAARHRVYAGTLNGTLSDRVDALDAASGLVEPYESGFAGVSALAVEPTGDLLVADDPGAATGALDSADQGRIFRVALGQLGRPVARIDAGPAAITRMRTALFRFSGPLGATFECRMDATTWAPCPALGQTAQYADLPDGPHRFEVRALTDLTGRPAARAFIVDTVAPRAWIAPQPTPAGGLRSSTVTADLLADEPGVDFSCSVDDGAFAPCDSALVLSGLKVGKHKVNLLGTDAAGNMSDPTAKRATWAFEILKPLPPAPPAPSTPAPATTTTPATPTTPAVPTAPGDDVPAGDSPAAGTGGLVAPQPRPLLYPVALRPVRVPRSQVRTVGLRMVLRFQAPPGARYAHVVVRGGDPRAAGARELVVRDVPLKTQGGTVRLEIHLTRAEAKRLRAGLHLVTVALGAERGALGNVQAHWLRVLPR